MNRYGLFGKFTSQKGKRDELVSILLQAAKLISTAKGSRQYIIYKVVEDADSVYVSEIWDIKEDHDNSLKIEGCRALISKAMPLIEGKPGATLLEVIEGEGIDSLNFYRHPEGFYSQQYSSTLHHVITQPGYFLAVLFIHLLFPIFALNT